MTTARQSKINTYTTELSHIAYTTIHNDEILKDVNNGIELYKNRAITEAQLTKVYKSALKQTSYKLKLGKRE